MHPLPTRPRNRRQYASRTPNLGAVPVGPHPEFPNRPPKRTDSGSPHAVPAPIHGSAPVVRSAESPSSAGSSDSSLPDPSGTPPKLCRAPAPSSVASPSSGSSPRSLTSPSPFSSGSPRAPGSPGPKPIRATGANASTDSPGPTSTSAARPFVPSSTCTRYPPTASGASTNDPSTRVNASRSSPRFGIARLNTDPRNTVSLRIQHRPVDLTHHRCLTIRPVRRRPHAQQPAAPAQGATCRKLPGAAGNTHHHSVSNSTQCNRSLRRLRDRPRFQAIPPTSGQISPPKAGKQQRHRCDVRLPVVHEALA